MFGQYEALRTRILAHARAISRSVSSLTHEQFDISKDSSRWHDIAAERIAASESLWQEAISRSCKRGQFNAACAMLLLFKDNVWSCGHLGNTRFNNIFAYQNYWCSWVDYNLTDIRSTRHLTIWRWRSWSWYTGISWIPLPRVASFTIKLLNLWQPVKSWKKVSPSCPLPKIKTSRFLERNILGAHKFNNRIN